METDLNLHWSDLLAKANDQAALKLAEHMTCLKVLRAFVNEALSERDSSHVVLKPYTAKVIPGDAELPRYMQVEFPGISAAWVLEIEHDYCKEIKNILHVYDVKDVEEEMILTVDTMDRLLHLSVEQKRLLCTDSQTAILMARQMRKYRSGIVSRVSSIWELPLLERYVYLEQKYNIERPQINPISHAFTGTKEHHPFLMEKTTVDLTLCKSRSNRILYQSAAPPVTEDLQGLQHLEEVAGEEMIIPLHPYTLERLRMEFADIAEDLVPVKQIAAYPTTSVRTLLYSAGDTNMHLKCSYPAQITSHSRVLNIEEALNGIRTSNIFFQLYHLGLLPAGVHFMPDLTVISHQDCSTMTTLVRAGLSSIYPRLGARQALIPSFAIIAMTPDNEPPLLNQLIDRSGLSPTEYFLDIANCLIEGYLGLICLGLGHESHAQNTLLICDLDDYRIKAMCFRDLESTKICKHILSQHGVNSEHHNAPNAAATRSKAVLEPDQPDIQRYFLTTGYTHGIIDSQLGYLAAHIARHYGLSEILLANETKKVYMNWWLKTGQSFESYCKLMFSNYLRRNLLSKGLGLKITSMPYRHINNCLFFPTWEEMERLFLLEQARSVTGL